MKAQLIQQTQMWTQITVYRLRGKHLDTYVLA